MIHNQTHAGRAKFENIPLLFAFALRHPCDHNHPLFSLPETLLLLVTFGLPRLGQDPWTQSAKKVNKFSYQFT